MAFSRAAASLVVVVVVVGCGSSDVSGGPGDAAPDHAAVPDAGTRGIDGGGPARVSDATAPLDGGLGRDPADASKAADASSPTGGDARSPDACGPEGGDAGVPRLLSAHLTTPSSIEVTFSARVGLSAPFDAAAFRLSYAMRTNAEGLLITVYQPLGIFMGGPDGGPSEFPFSSLSLGACGRRATLALERPLAPAAVCAALERLAVGADVGTAGLYLHAGTGTHLEDGAHRALEPVVPEFLPPGDDFPLPDKFVVHEYDPAPPLAALLVDVGCPDAGK